VCVCVCVCRTAYKAAGNKRVHFVTHSMGGTNCWLVGCLEGRMLRKRSGAGPTTLYFLNAMPAAWKTTYIASFIPLGSLFISFSFSSSAV
jgi:hypothetical protein